jgi:hypothetical protein
MTRQVSILIILLFSTLCGFSQTDGLNLYLNGADLKSNTIEALNTKELAFRFEFLGQSEDTIKLNVIHHKGIVPLSQAHYIFNDNPLEFTIIKDPQIKPGDNLTFTFRIGRQQIVKSYVVTSTTDQLNKPYYVDIYFLYNKDTLTTESFNIPTKLTNQKKEKLVRIEFDDPKQLPKNISVQYDKEVFTYEVHFPKGQLFHGRIVLEYIDKKKMKSQEGFKSIATTDLDIGPDFTYTRKNVF